MLTTHRFSTERSSSKYRQLVFPFPGEKSSEDRIIYLQLSFPTNPFRFRNLVILILGNAWARRLHWKRVSTLARRVCKAETKALYHKLGLWSKYVWRPQSNSLAKWLCSQMSFALIGNQAVNPQIQSKLMLQTFRVSFGFQNSLSKVCVYPKQNKTRNRSISHSTLLVVCNICQSHVEWLTSVFFSTGSKLLIPTFCMVHSIKSKCVPGGSLTWRVNICSPFWAWFKTSCDRRGICGNRQPPVAPSWGLTVVFCIGEQLSERRAPRNDPFHLILCSRIRFLEVYCCKGKDDLSVPVSTLLAKGGFPTFRLWSKCCFSCWSGLISFEFERFLSTVSTARSSGNHVNSSGPRSKWKDHRSLRKADEGCDGCFTWKPVGNQLPSMYCYRKTVCLWKIITLVWQDWQAGDRVPQASFRWSLRRWFQWLPIGPRLWSLMHLG